MIYCGRLYGEQKSANVTSQMMSGVKTKVDSADFPGEWALGFDRAALFCTSILIWIGFFSLWLFLSKIHPESSAWASKTPFCLRWYKTWLPVHFWKPLTFFLCLSGNTFSSFSIPNAASDHPTTVRRQRPCSRPTRQQTNQPVRNSCLRTLQNCRATNVGHLPRCLFFCCLFFFPLFIGNTCCCCTLILLPVSGGEWWWGRLGRTLIWWLQF